MELVACFSCRCIWNRPKVGAKMQHLVNKGSRVKYKHCVRYNAGIKKTAHMLIEWEWAYICINICYFKVISRILRPLMPASIISMWCDVIMIYQTDCCATCIMINFVELLGELCPLDWATTTTTTTTTTILWLSGFCLGQPEWASTRRNVHSLTPILVISHPLSASFISYDPWHPPCLI